MAQILPDLLRGGVTTVEIAVGAWLLAGALGLLFAVGRDVGGPVINAIIVVGTNVLRSVPQLIVLYLLYFGLGAVRINVPSIAAAIVGLALVESAYTAEYFRAGFLTVPTSQHDAGRSLGLGRLSVLRLIVIPQAALFAIPPLVNSLVALLKTATLAAAVAAPEMLYAARNDIGRYGLIVPIMLTVIVVYVVATIPLTRLASYLEQRIRARLGS